MYYLVWWTIFLQIFIIGSLQNIGVQTVDLESLMFCNAVQLCFLNLAVDYICVSAAFWLPSGRQSCTSDMNTCKKEIMNLNLISYKIHQRNQVFTWLKYFICKYKVILLIPSTPSETDILNRLEKAFNKITIPTKETKEKCRKLDIQTVVQEKNIIDLETYIFNICFSKHISVFQRQCLIMHQ